MNKNLGERDSKEQEWIKLGKKWDAIFYISAIITILFAAGILIFVPKHTFLFIVVLCGVFFTYYAHDKSFFISYNRPHLMEWCDFCQKEHKRGDNRKNNEHEED